MVHDSRLAAARGRIFLLDPACVQSVGHNLGSLWKWHRQLSKRGEVIVLGCRYLPEDVAREGSFHRFFEWYYPGIFAEADYPIPAPPCASLREGDRFEAVATSDAERFLHVFNVGPTDVVVFPSADIFGVLGLIGALAGRPPSRWPQVRLRLINVMEHAAPTLAEPREVMLERIGLAVAQGMPVRVSAETAGYAAYLAAKLNLPVTVTPLPTVLAASPLPRSGPFVVGHLGKPRRDKGFFDLLEIVRAVAASPEGRNIRFAIQAPGPRAFHEAIDYMCRLYAVPQVDLVPDNVNDDAAWRELFRNCHCILLPYDRHTYELRGSAIAMEAADFGRPIITVAGVGFAAETAYYGLGKIAQSPLDCAAAARALSRMPVEELERGMCRGNTLRAEAFERDCDTWLWRGLEYPS